MSAKVGDSLPDVNLYENNPANAINIKSLCSSGKVLIFGVPGAFTPGCSMTHLPGYIRDADSYREKGIKEIVCVSVNDPFVMAAWGKEHKTESKVRMLADTDASFTKAMGLDQDLPVLGGIRSKRFSMVVEDGTIGQMQVEPDGKGLSCSLSENILAII